MAIATGIAGLESPAKAGAAARKPRIVGLVRREETMKRLDLVVSTSAITWAADDRLFAGVSDGVDPASPPKRTFHARVFALQGEPSAPTFEDLSGYPDIPFRKTSDEAAFWGGSCLALDGRIYQYLMTPNHSYLKPDTSFWPDFRFVGAKLIYSPDNGRTWNNQDGSHPVKWENWDDRSRDNMMFFHEEPPGAFVLPTFLQMGRNYELNKDGFVYLYSVNGDVEGTANRLVLCRTPKARILERHSYEFFAGMRANGAAAWTRDIKKCSVVHTFPEGWVSKGILGQSPAGWSVSVTYNEPLGVYMMAAQGTGVAANGGWFGKPSYLGFWVAPTPWGPFRQIHEESAWMPGGDRAARAFAPQISPKWMAADGKSFWLVWSDYQYQTAQGEGEHPDKGLNDATKGIVDDAELAPLAAQYFKKHMPGYKFNMQRVDLVVTE